MKVTEKDLVGQLTGFPIEVVEKMIEEQVKQGNKADVEVFKNDIEAEVYEDGFSWNLSYDGFIFWRNIIRYKNFYFFFERYPKKIKNVKVYIYQDGTVNPNLLIKTLETYGAVNEGNYNGENTGSYYYIDPNNRIGVIHGKYITTVELIKDNYTEIKVLEEKKTIKISKSLMMGILSLPGNAEDYNFEFDD